MSVSIDFNATEPTKPAVPSRRFGRQLAAVRGADWKVFEPLSATQGELASLSKLYKDNFGPAGLTILEGTEANLIPPDPSVVIDQPDYSFEELASFDRLAAAWRNQDSEQITDIALKFLEGERVLLRSHKKIKAADVIDIAIRVATERNDKTSLDRLAKAMLREGDKEGAELVNISLATAGAARSSAPVLREDSPEVVAEIESFVLAIESARIAGSQSQLTTLQSKLTELSVSDAQQMALGKLIEESQDSMEANDTTLEVIKELEIR